LARDAATPTMVRHDRRLRVGRESGAVLLQRQRLAPHRRESGFAANRPDKKRAGVAGPACAGNGGATPEGSNHPPRALTRAAAVLAWGVSGYFFTTSW
jgi:hypothetical protein